MGPAEAIRAGATYIVVGRPIIGAPDPRGAAERIVQELTTVSVTSR
jgi:orotidine-5'-phosphate decarboxylase